MFTNIGKKLKALAKTICWLGILSSVIISFIFFILDTSLFSEGGPLSIIAIIILILGPLFSWLGSFFMYGFGELVDKTCDIEMHMRHQKSAPATVSGREQAENLLAKGLITEQEYRQIIAGKTN